MKYDLLLFTILFCISSSVSAKEIKEKEHLLFIENKGQIKDQFARPRNDIDFKLSSGSAAVFIGDGELHYQFYKNISGDSIASYRMDVVLLNANKNAAFITEGQQPYFEHYYNTDIPTKAHSFTKVIYKDIYPSIDWVLYIKDGGLEYDFVVHKGGNAAEINIGYNGATSLKINNDGSFTAITPLGSISEAAPYSYQQDGKEITSSFILENNVIGFKTAQHVGSLTIDPKIAWATYFGGENEDLTSDIDCDDAGYIYMCGGTRSVNNIATTGSYQVFLSGIGDAFISKFTSEGNLIWATYYGGDSSDAASGIVCDQFNNIYIAGNTVSSNGIASSGSHQQTLSLHGDGFLAKFTNDGELLWDTYYGGDSLDAIYSVSCDDSSNVLITGHTWSTDNISTPGAHKTTLLPLSNGDAFLVKFDSMGVRKWGTYFGGDGVEHGTDVTVDGNNNIYITGSTESVAGIATPNAYKLILEGMNDGFISKFTSGGQVIWSTYFGGTFNDGVQALAIRGEDLYITGNTYSPDGIATPGTFQQNLQGVGCGFLARFDTAGNRIWGTYFGVANSTTNWGIAADNSGLDIYFIGAAGGHLSNLTTPDAPQKDFGGGVEDMIIGKFTSFGTRVWSTYYGSCTVDEGHGATVNNSGELYVSGHTSSNFMATPGSYQAMIGGNADALLIKFKDTAFGIIGDTALCAGTTATYYASFVPGADSYTWTLPNGWVGTSTVDTITVTAGTTSGTISVVANKSCSTEPPQELYITVYPLPAPVIYLTGINGNIIAVQGTYVSYQWNNSSGPIPGATSPTYTITDPNEPYSVTVTDANGCTGTSSYTITLSLPDDEFNNNITLHPNPNTGNFTLEAHNLTNSKTASIAITDITGRELMQQEVPIMNNSINQHITLLKDLPAGQYFLKLNSQEINKTIKFTKL